MEFTFVSYEEFPEDLYTKELVYLLVNGQRIAYVRKEAKNGGMFWSIPSIAVTKEGVKTYYEAHLRDSAFLDKDIKHFLDERSWEKSESLVKEAPKSNIHDEEIPF